MEARKIEEMRFHDAYRTKYAETTRENRAYTANRKYYSIARKSNLYVRAWLDEKAVGKRVLEYGCGGGSYSFQVARAASHVTGVDISSDSIELCRARAISEGLSDKCSFEVMDCEHLTFPDASFDVVCESGVLHHLDLSAVWPQLARILSPGGSVICTEALRHNPLFHLYRKLTPKMRTEWETEHILSVPQIESASAYFETVEIKYFHLASLAAVVWRNRPGFDSLLEGLERVDDAILSLPWIQRQAWMAVVILSGPRKGGRST